ncbi:Uncharacterised protein [Burkholderia pseudomallei]|nr:Uncharacterised protein [Burkholderia pseudomallei]CAJ3094224.1 Uncharacterised protein [Burkholderia pseudomallei]CAJ3205120.1 Uncharacterised protein [Burkholderia pseudomallei]CAJ3270787.1 Uncharacterised protein [Burkholderia pseudomallei]CAJ3274459.1 Uncharacterised protein [Burkholderia pseudomallei]
MLPLRCSRPAVSISISMSFCPSTMATRSSSCCVALNSMRFIERLQAALPAARSGCQAERGTTSGRALLCCHKHAGAGMMAGEWPDEARTHTAGRGQRAPANTASKHTASTLRAPQGALSLRPGTAAGRGASCARRRVAAYAAARPQRGVSNPARLSRLGCSFLGFDVAKPRALAGPYRAHAVLFATGGCAGPTSCRAAAANKFFLSNIPLPRHGSNRIRLWARSLPERGAVRATCCFHS